MASGSTSEVSSRSSVATWWRDRAPWQAGSLAVTGIVLLGLHLIEPHRWFTGDMRNQYVPVFRDIGRRLRDGELPTIDPNLGPSGNYSLDVQYGVYDPAHWVLSVVVSHVDDLALAAFLMALVYSCLLALGATCLCLRLGASGWWSVVAGVAAATSGYVAFELSVQWVPGLLSLVWVPWLWWAAVGRVTLRRVLAIAVLTYLVIAGGWPSTWLTFGALALGIAAETIVARDRARPWSDPAVQLGVKASAALGGLLVAFIGIVPALQADRWTVRRRGVVWDDFLVPHLLDVLNNIAPRTSVSMNTFGPDVETSPFFFFGWFIVVLLWCTRWRRDLWRRPGVMTGIVASLLALATTQLPGQIGALRDPIRQLAGFQVLAVLTVVVVASAGVVVTRRRVIGVALTTVAMLGVGWWRARHPERDVPWTLLVVAAIVVLVVLLAKAGLNGRSTGVVALAMTVGLFTVAWALTPTGGRLVVGPAVIRPAAISVTAADQPVFVFYSRPPSHRLEQWFRTGVGRGFQRLTADNRVMPGYSSVSSAGFRALFRTHAAHGYSRDRTIRRMLRIDQQTGLPWTSLLGLRTVLVERSMLPVWRRAAGPGWQRVDSSRFFVQLRRRGPSSVSGRVTYASPDVSVRAVDVQRHTQSYDVAAPQGGRLVMRDVYWPGYTATLDGRPVRVGPFADTLVSVRVPPGTRGRLTVTWQPQTTTSVAGLGGGGALCVGLALAVTWWWRRREVESEQTPST